MGFEKVTTTVVFEVEIAPTTRGSASLKIGRPPKTNVAELFAGSIGFSCRSWTQAAGDRAQRSLTWTVYSTKAVCGTVMSTTCVPWFDIVAPVTTSSGQVAPGPGTMQEIEKLSGSS